MDIEDFYEGNPARRGSPEYEFGRSWIDESGTRWEVSWVETTGELYAMAETEVATVEVLGRLPSQAAAERALAGWPRAMKEPDGIRWIRDRLEGFATSRADGEQSADDIAISVLPGASVIDVDPRLRAVVALGMATVTVGLVAFIWLIFGLDDLAPAIVGCFVGMLIMVGFTSVGRDMSEGLLSWRDLRRRRDRAQQRQIWRTIRRGRAVDDRELAPDAIRMARDYERRFARSSLRPWILIVTGAFLALALVQARWVGVALAGGLLLCLVAAEPLRRRNLQKARRATAANVELLDETG